MGIKGWIQVGVLGINSLSTNCWKAGSNHFSISIVLFHICIISPCSKALFIHRNHPVHSLSLNTFLFRIWKTCANVNKISYAYATSGESASDLLITFISLGRYITIWCTACILSAKSFRTLVSISTDRLCVCFLEKYRITKSVPIIPIASPKPENLG